MLRYIFQRILLAIPTLLAVSLLAFSLNKCAPGDPVEKVFGEITYHSLDPAQQGEEYLQKAAQLGLDRPDFYFDLSTAAYPDSLWKISPLNRRTRLEKLIGQTGNWPAVRAYDAALSAFIRNVESLPDSIGIARMLRAEVTMLIVADKSESVAAAAERVAALAVNVPALQNSTHTLLVNTQTLTSEKKPEQLRLPAFHWHGLNNQYHYWLGGFLSGNLGLTRRKAQVWDELYPSLLMSLTINGLAVLLAYLVAVPLGVEMARKKGRMVDRWGKRGLFFLYSMPVFWLGGLLILLAYSTEWGRSILPSVYFDVEDGWRPGKSTFGAWWQANSAKCVMPIAVLMLHALAVIALQMRGSMLRVLEQDYIRTARAKGLQEEDIYWRHALRNALFPIITIFASTLPAVFAGSLVVETLFGFPGIGSKTFEAYMAQDLPMLSAIMMVAAAIAIFSSLLADLLYALADPRVRFER